MNVDWTYRLITWIGVPISVGTFYWMITRGYRVDVSVIVCGAVVMVPFSIANWVFHRNNKLVWGSWLICLVAVLIGALSLGGPLEVHK